MKQERSPSFKSSSSPSACTNIFILLYALTSKSDVLYAALESPSFKSHIFKTKACSFCCLRVVVVLSISCSIPGGRT